MEFTAEVFRRDADDFSENEQHWLTGWNIVTSCISLAGSSFIVLSMIYLAMKSKSDPADGTYGLLKHLHFRLVFLLSTSDVLYSIAMFFGDPEDGSGLCYTQAFFVHFFGTFSVASVFCIAVTLWGSFVRQWPTDDQEFERTLFFKYVVAIFAFSLTLSCLPFSDGNHYGNSGAWCWIDDTDAGQVLRYVSFYIWLWLAIAIICVMYYQLLQTLHSLMHQDNPDRGGLGDMFAVVICGAQGPDKDNVHTTEMIRVMRRLSLYPIILIGCWIFGTANRIQNSANRHNPNMGLVVMHMVTSNLNGFFNSLVYGCNDSLYGQLALHCCGKQNTQNDTDGKFEVQMDEVKGGGQVAVIAEAEVTHRPDQGRTMKPI